MKVKVEKKYKAGVELFGAETGSLRASIPSESDGVILRCDHGIAWLSATDARNIGNYLVAWADKLEDNKSK